MGNWCSRKSALSSTCIFFLTALKKMSQYFLHLFKSSRSSTQIYVEMYGSELRWLFFNFAFHKNSFRPDSFTVISAQKSPTNLRKTHTQHNLQNCPKFFFVVVVFKFPDFLILSCFFLTEGIAIIFFWTS